MGNPSKGSFLVKNFLRYSVIFSEGTRGDTAYLLKEGMVEISKEMDGKKKVFAHLRPPSMFGEMAILLDDEKRTATAVALEDSKVVEIKKYDFQEYLKQSPVIISTLVNVLVHRLKTATVKSLRVPNLFIGICNVFGLMAQGGVTTFNYLDTLNTLAATFNTNKESIDKALSMLEQHKIIEFFMNDNHEKTIRLLETKDLAHKVAERTKGA
ncbi:CRP-like cAMP-binding protein [Desulfobaculum xiamenense]|uniref:CRP-like cAMP-binding protein n=1 Tax=Desulfobaculum xiamenense TaxID=995050 RepID=A0A846QST3_9BACT|nr:cyclic nucleotide-binding domain-containing protein [Desulfobaculum xiamenense]NJB68234.1 CRP-like cAMP-binding protein [Desulfobaculum xiamenense]